MVIPGQGVSDKVSLKNPNFYFPCLTVAASQSVVKNIRSTVFVVKHSVLSLLEVSCSLNVRTKSVLTKALYKP